MRALDFRDRFLLLLSIHSAWEANEEITYQQWLELRKEINDLLADAGSESRCAHSKPLYQGILCIHCGRKPARDNTLPPPEAA
jgi:hypothetical protein